MFVLSSVLYKAIFSVYRLGGPNVRSDLHGPIEPRSVITCMLGEVTPSSREDDLFVILWTSTRDDLRHWVPNHALPAVARIHSKALCMHISVSYQQWPTDAKHGLLRKHQ